MRVIFLSSHISANDTNPVSDTIIPDEVLPPSDKGPGKNASRGASASGAKIDPQFAFPQLIAHVLDGLIKIPALRTRLGLDALLALIPGFGSLLATGLGSTLLLNAVKKGVPVHVLVRMGGNMVANSILNAIPFVGPFLTIWFRSNQRNFEILKAHVNDQAKPPASHQVKILFLVLGLLLVLCIIAGLYLWKLVWQLF
jgi:hypothetical protein